MYYTNILIHILEIVNLIMFKLHDNASIGWNIIEYYPRLLGIILFYIVVQERFLFKFINHP